VNDVLVGVIGKPFGLHGEVYVRPDPDVSHTLTPGTVYTSPGDHRLTLVAVREHADRLLVRFDGVTDRTGAERLRGVQLHVPRDVVAADADTFWTDDLLGREVVDADGVVVGVVGAVADGPAHDYLIVARTDGGEVMVPAVGDLLDITDEQVVVQPLPGLLDPGTDET